MNLLIQRAGEASRAALLYRREKVPFAKGFGSIMAERAVDMILLMGLFGLTMLLQFDKLDLFKERIALFRATQGPAEPGGAFPWLWVVGGVLVMGAAAGAYFMVTRPVFHSRVMEILRGLGEGLRSLLASTAYPKQAMYLGQVSWPGSWLEPSGSCWCKVASAFIRHSLH